MREATRNSVNRPAIEMHIGSRRGEEQDRLMNGVMAGAIQAVQRVIDGRRSDDRAERCGDRFEPLWRGHMDVGRIVLDQSLGVVEYIAFHAAAPPQDLAL